MNKESKKADQLDDEEAERRATDALRRALNTPYKPQRDMVGKGGVPAKSNAAKSTKKTPAKQ